MCIRDRVKEISPPKISVASSCKPDFILSLKVPIEDIVKTPKNRHIKKTQNLFNPPLRSLNANFNIDKLDNLFTFYSH